MAVEREPQIGEQVSLHITPKQRKAESGDQYLLRYESATGQIIECGDQHAPWVYKVDFGDDLPALVRLSNLRTIEGEPFKTDKKESNEVVGGAQMDSSINDNRPSEKIKEVIREDIEENQRG